MFLPDIAGFASFIIKSSFFIDLSFASLIFNTFIVCNEIIRKIQIYKLLEVAPKYKYITIGVTEKISKNYQFA